MRVTNTGLQSLLAIILVTLFLGAHARENRISVIAESRHFCVAGFHLKVRPYKMDLLDRLDMVRTYISAVLWRMLKHYISRFCS